MEEKAVLGELLIGALEEAVEHPECRLTARVDRVEITRPASELRGMLDRMNTDFERDEDRF